MTTFFKQNNIDLSVAYITNTATITPSTFFLNNRIDISNNFILYMFGTVKNSFFRTNKLDVCSFFQSDTFTRAVILNNNGDTSYRLSPFPTTVTQLQYSKWLWNISSAWDTAPGNEYLWFYSSFYSYSSYTGILYYGQPTMGATSIYFNGTSLASYGAFVSYNGATFSINVKIGLNYIRIAAYNASGNACIIAAIYDNNSKLVNASSNNWAMSTSTSYNTGSLPYNK